MVEYKIAGGDTLPGDKRVHLIGVAKIRALVVASDLGIGMSGEDLLSWQV